MGKIKQSTVLYELLEQKFRLYNRPDFIIDDPICIPHRFSQKEDIEIAGFLAATIAWGQRKTIIKNSNRMLEIMDNDPYNFIINHRESDLKSCEGFVHRTFNADDLICFIRALHHIYANAGGLENIFAQPLQAGVPMPAVICRFKEMFFSITHLRRTQKHVADPLKGSSAKRTNMFLRWMVRKDNGGVDFGLWNTIPGSKLMLPLDVHTATVGRKLGLLKRKQNDWKAVEEITERLRAFDPADPVKYDFALFGMGAMGNMK
jgi:uncharacterized protein (TIGR02757 family)